MIGGLKNGLYATVGGVEYPLQPVDGSWCLLSLASMSDPRWYPFSNALWVCPVTAAEVDRVDDVINRGTYRGVAVEVGSRPLGGYEVTSNDVEAAVAVGMSQSDRTFARASVAVDDPDLVFHEERTEVPFPR